MDRSLYKSIAVAASCAALASSAFLPTSVRAADPYTLDVILPLTGPAAFLGKVEQRGLQALQKSVNDQGGIRGRQIVFEYNDDQGSPAIAVQLENAILQKHPVAILGPALTGTCSAVEPLIRDNGPVQYCFSPGLQPQAKSYMFAGSRALEAMIGPELRFANDHGWTRVGMLAATDASGLADERAIAASLPQYNKIVLVDKEEFSPADINVTAAVSKIKAAQPQVVFVWASGPAFANVIQAMSALGVNVPVVTSSANLVDATLQPLQPYLPPALLFDGFAFQVAISSGHKNVDNAVTQFQGAVKAAGFEPEPVYVYAWDPARIVLSGFQKFGFGVTGAQLRDYMANLNGFAGVSGAYDFRKGDQHGLGPDSMVIVKWDPKAGTSAASGPGGSALPGVKL